MTSDEVQAELDALEAEIDVYEMRGALIPMELWRRRGDVMMRLMQALRAEGSPAAVDEGPTYRYRVSFDCTEPTWLRIKEFLGRMPAANRGYTYEAVPGPEGVPFSAARGGSRRNSAHEAGPVHGEGRPEQA